VQRVLSVQYVDLGDALQGAGKLAEALESFQQSLALRQRLAESAPENATWQAYLRLSYQRIGNVLKAQNNLVDALTAFQNEASILGKLAQAHPVDPRWQRPLATCNENIGDVLRGLRRLEEGLAAYRVAVGIREKLLDGLSPGARDKEAWARDELAVSYQRLGDILHALDQFEDAQQAFERGVALARELVALDDSNAKWRHLLQLLLANSGYLFLDAAKPQEALPFLDEAVSLAPDDARVLFARARAELYASRLAAVVDEMAQAVGLDTSDAYKVLWLHIVRMRAGQVTRTSSPATPRRLTQPNGLGRWYRSISAVRISTQHWRPLRRLAIKPNAMIKCVRPISTSASTNFNGRRCRRRANGCNPRSTSAATISWNGQRPRSR
jgi:tetratricopeptide (TPR) repeat protein